jgi:hypothetical protein
LQDPQGCGSTFFSVALTLGTVRLFEAPPTISNIEVLKQRCYFICIETYLAVKRNIIFIIFNQEDDEKNLHHFVCDGLHLWTVD